MEKKYSSIYDRFLEFIEKYYYLFLGIIFLVAIFNLFFYLKATPIYSWDEARHGVSAYEMLKENQFVVNTYGYKYDYWNLKPPVSFLFIALGYKIAGFNTLGLRLFSAIAALLTIAIIAFFARYKYGRIASLISALILTVSPKYIVIHSARTGDADSLFVLFFTLSIISAILSEKNIKWLYLSGFSFSLAFLTKSWHAANIVIIVFLYLVFTGRLFKLKIKEWILFVVSSVSLILIWGILRYTRDGFTFFKLMVNYDLLSRTSSTVEGHKGNIWYYFNILQTYYLVWLGLLALGIIFYVILYRGNNIERSKRNYALALILWISVPMLMFTAAKTKIGWYILPVYPPIALSIGGLCGVLMRGTKKNTAVQIVIMVSILTGVVYYEPVIVRQIVMFKNDQKRVNINYDSSFSNIRGSRAYIYYGRDAKINYGPESQFKSWLQSDLLSVELYWDITPLDGGLQGFLKDKNYDDILIAVNNPECQDIINKYKLKIIDKDKSVYILKK